MSCRSVPEPGGRPLTDGTRVTTRSLAQPPPSAGGAGGPWAPGKVGGQADSAKLADGSAFGRARPPAFCLLSGEGAGWGQLDARPRWHQGCPSAGGQGGGLVPGEL